MIYPTVCVTLLTAHRMEYAKPTLESVLKNLKYSGPIRLHIADDGSPEGYTNDLFQLATSYMDSSLITISNSNGRGYGANYNLSTMDSHRMAEVVLPLEDDWEMYREFNIDIFVEALLSDFDFGCIRMGYIGYTRTLCANFEWHLNHHWLRLNPDSDEPHVFSGHPRLETVSWQKKVGLWPEGLNPGGTEFALTYRREAREGVIWPVDFIGLTEQGIFPPLFCHIGTEKSYA